MGNKLIIFDFDGTLVDSLDIWAYIDEEYFGSRNLDYKKVESFSGMTVFEAASFSKEFFNIDEEVEDIMKEWTDIAVRLYPTKATLREGAISFFDKLREKGYNIAIGTSNALIVVKEYIKNKKLDKYIDYIFTGTEAENGKPEPDIFLEIARHFDISPKDVIVVEDSLEGVMAGKNAGMYVYAIAEKYSKKNEEKIKKIADKFICSFEEIEI